jgi:hypothetical protein
MPLERRLGETFELRGEFWRPQEPDDRVKGFLKYDAGRTELSLVGVFGGFASMITETDVIVGLTDAGYCTLTQAIRVHAVTKLAVGDGPEHSAWTAQLLIVGASFENIDDVRFQSMSFRFEELEAWLAQVPFEQAHGYEASGPVATARHEFPPSEPIELPIHGAKLSVEFAFSTGGDLFRSLEWSRTAAFKLVVHEPRSFDWFMRRWAHIRALLGLLLGEAATPSSILGKLPEDEAAEFPIYFNPIGQTRERVLHPAEMVLSRDKLGDRFGDVVQEWFEKEEALSSTLVLFFGTLYFGGLPTDFQFLTLTQALETFHRRRFGGFYVSDDQYAPIETALEAAIPPSTPPDLRQALKTRMGFGNEFSQRRRFKDLLDSLDANQSLVGPDPIAFMGSVVDHRNYLTHYPAGEDVPMSPTQAFYASARLRTFLTLLLLAEVGISGNAAAEAVRRSRWHRGFVGT